MTRVLITGVCGFVGTTLARELPRHREGIQILGIDNLSRPGSEVNRTPLVTEGIRVWYGDLRVPSELEMLPAADWGIDAAANPSVLAGAGGASSSRQLMEHNLVGTVHLLEYCRRHGSGLLMLSTSRVYSAAGLAALPVTPCGRRLEPNWAARFYGRALNAKPTAKSRFRSSKTS